MQCPSCLTDLPRPSRFCPFCGVRTDGIFVDGPHAAGAEDQALEARRPHLATVDGEPVGADRAGHADGTVVYLPGSAEHQALAAESQPVAAPRRIGQIHGEDFDRVFAGSDETPAPSSFRPDSISWLILLVSTLLILIAFGWFAAATQEQAGGGEAGAFILLAATMMCWYLSRPRAQQHGFVVQGYGRYAQLIDHRVDPFRARTELGIQLRRERERSGTVRKERARRVNDLGEAAYRLYRAGMLESTLVEHAQRIELMERHMLVQDERVNELLEQRARVDADDEEVSPEL